jgi:sugar/nucleoside kinase (ribokinase family)
MDVQVSQRAFCCRIPPLTARHRRLQASPAPGAPSFHQGGSIPGSVRFVPGGVARNIAHDLALLGRGTHPLLLLTAVGDDAAGAALKASWQAMKLPTRGIHTVSGGATPTVSIIFDGRGDVAASMADVALLETALTPAVLQRFSAYIRASDVVLLDGDLSEAAIEAAARCAAAAPRPPLLWFEPVSAPKAARATAILSFLDYASPNMAELRAMAAAVALKHAQRGCAGPRSPPSSTTSAESILAAARPLLQLVLEQGLKAIVLTLGSQGAALCTLSPDRRAVRAVHAPALPASVVNCSGAGDCLVAGFLHGLATGCAPAAALALGAAAAKRAVQAATNVPPNLSAADLEQDAAEAERLTQTLTFPCGCCCAACCAAAGSV